MKHFPRRFVCAGASLCSSTHVWKKVYIKAQLKLEQIFNEIIWVFFCWFYMVHISVTAFKICVCFAQLFLSLSLFLLPCWYCTFFLLFISYMCYSFAWKLFLNIHNDTLWMAFEYCIHVYASIYSMDFSILYCMVMKIATNTMITTKIKSKDCGGVYVCTRTWIPFALSHRKKHFGRDVHFSTIRFLLVFVS